jgi:cytochrome c oxidase assembly protein subunit 11
MVDAHYSEARRDGDNRRVVAILVGIVVGMTCLAYAAVPLYDAFCAATGYGGTTQRATDNPKGVIAREMTTRFDANIEPGLSLHVVPSQPVEDQIGTVRTVHFTARNLTDKTITTTAGFNVTPEMAGAYFNKIECFCFTEQTLKPGETADMPVMFFVDPDIDQNPDLKTVKALTLSYTFYAVDNGGS